MSPSDRQRITETLIKDMIATAGRLSEHPGYWWCDQLNNHDAIAGYAPLSEAIWRQTGGHVDAFVHAVGTAHSIHGAGEVLRRRNPAVHIAAVEPEESAVLSGRPSSAHRIEGIGIGFHPPLWEPAKVDEIIQMTTADAQAMARRLAREEAIFAGSSSGANVAAAVRIAERLGPDAVVATIIVDSGLRYISTGLFQ